MPRAGTHKKKNKRHSFMPILIILLVIGAIAAALYIQFNSKNLSSQTNAVNNNPAINKSNNIVADNNSSDTNNNNTTANIQSNSTTNRAVNSSNNKAVNNSANASNTLQNNTSSNSEGNNYPVSIAKAESILNDKINKGAEKTKLNYDHVQARDNQTYYAFSAAAPSGDSQSSNTVGWYYVNVNTGEAYSWNLIDNTLNPLK